MDWEDFENLIREIFQEEFSQGGGEVKITQASRDGGVDAVAFDPTRYAAAKSSYRQSDTPIRWACLPSETCRDADERGSNEGHPCTTSD